MGIFKKFIAASVIEVANRAATNNSTTGITTIASNVNTVANNLSSHKSSGSTTAHSIANIAGLQTTLDGKANSVHTHLIADVAGLQGILDDKQNRFSGYTGVLTVVTAVNFAGSSVTTAVINIENGIITSII